MGIPSPGTWNTQTVSVAIATPHLADGNPQDVHPISLASRKDRRAFSFNTHSVEACAGEVSGSTLNSASVWLLEGRGALAIGGFGVNPDDCQSVQFERVALLLGRGFPDPQTAMAGRVSVSKHCLDVGHCVATVSGAEDSTFFARFDTDKPVSIQAKLHRIVAPVIDAEVGRVFVSSERTGLKSPCTSSNRLPSLWPYPLQQNATNLIFCAAGP
jgi:hypothetical protein